MGIYSIEKSQETKDQNFDILLVVPPTYPEGRNPDYNPKPPLGLEYLSGYLKKDDFSSLIRDFDVVGASAEEVVQDILTEDPPILGMTVLQRALPSVKYIHRQLRERGFDKPIIYGGIGATLCAEEILQEFQDPNCIIVLGEGEEPLNQIVKAIKNGQEDTKEVIPSIMYYDASTDALVKNSGGRILNLDEIPWPDRQNLDFYLDKSGYLTILTSRGCPWSRCTFCSNAAFEQQHEGDTWRSRSPEDVVEEMISLYTSTGVKKFKTNDANLFGIGKKGEDYVVNLCNAIQDAKSKGSLPNELSIMSFIRGEDVAGKLELLKLMKSSGFDRLLIGVESSVNEVLLKKFKKGENIEILTQAINDLKDVGISPVIGFLIFNPYTTLASLEKDLQFLEENSLKVNLSKSLRIFNNTPIQFLLMNAGKLEKNSPFETYHEYFVSGEISAIYHSMKALHVLIEDPIRKIAQDRIWQIKKVGDSFNERFNYDDLVGIFWSMEVKLLKSCIEFYNKNEIDEDVIKTSVDEIYAVTIKSLLEQLSIDNREGLMTSEEFYSNILEILREKKTNNLHEEYVWSEI